MLGYVILEKKSKTTVFLQQQFCNLQIHGGVGPTAERRETYLEKFSPSLLMILPQPIQAYREGRIQPVVLARDWTSHLIANNAGSFAPPQTFGGHHYYVIVVLSHNKGGAGVGELGLKYVPQRRTLLYYCILLMYDTPLCVLRVEGAGDGQLEARMNVTDVER